LKRERESESRAFASHPELSRLRMAKRKLNAYKKNRMLDKKNSRKLVEKNIFGKSKAFPALLAPARKREHEPE